MERVIDRVVAVPAHLGARVDARGVTSARNASPIGFVTLWRDALVTFSTHVAPILVCACIGFAVPGALAAWIGLTLNGNQPPALCPFRALPDWPLLVPLLATMLFAPLASGVIARLALDGTHQGCGLRAACVAAVKRLPALALGWLVYGTLMAGAMLWLTPVLHDVQLDPLSVRDSVWRTRPANGVVRETLVRGVGILIPDPGPTLCGVGVMGRASLFASAVAGGASMRGLVSPENPFASASGMPAVLAYSDYEVPHSWLSTLVCLVVLVVAETVLRFRVVAIMQSSTVGPCRAMVDSVRLAGQHFGAVTRHVWLLRLAVTGAHVLLVGLPVAFVQQIMVPDLSLIAGLTWMRPVCMLLIPVGVAVAEGIFIAFGAVYDARLFVTLQSTSPVG